MKYIIMILMLSFGNIAQAKEEARETSLLEATVYTGLPTLTLTAGIWYNQLTTDKHLVDNFTWGFKNAPVFDSNPWYVNYVGHPIVGSETYLLARNRGHSVLESFVYSAAASVIWEYGIESWHGARPSIQDLIITPAAGSIIGELRSYAKKKLMRYSDSTLGKVLIVILDAIDAVYISFE